MSDLPDDDQPLIDAARQFVRLMDDPQPGLVTWSRARCRAAMTLYSELHKRLGEDGE